MIGKKFIAILRVVLLLLVGSAAFGWFYTALAAPPGVPFQDLQDQIDQIQLTPGPPGPPGSPGPTGAAGGIKVLDANDLELGLLVAIQGQCKVDLFLPSLAVFLRLMTCDLGNPPLNGEWFPGFPKVEELKFEDEACSRRPIIAFGSPKFPGQATFAPGWIFTDTHGPVFSGRLYQAAEPIPTVKRLRHTFRIEATTGQCLSSGGGPETGFKVMEAPPLPFGFPVALPLQFVTE